MNTQNSPIPFDIGALHFVGIGGIGMSGIAEILHNLGYIVRGSDMQEGGNVQRLRSLGIDVLIGHKRENITGDVAVVVKSTAVGEDNPEIVAARQARIPVIRRSEMLAELTRLKATIAVAGSHGKTTTTSMIATIMAHAGMDPTVINGGIINSLSTNAYLGRGDWLVAEADESDGTFVRIPARVGVITNLDPEHLDYWGDFAALKEAFERFIHQLPFYGFVVACVDDGDVASLITPIRDRRIITYSVSGNPADYSAFNLRYEVDGTMFDITAGGQELRDIRLPMPGKHNVANALGAVIVARELGIDDGAIADALAQFSGVKRRFSLLGEVNGVAIVDDYGHHPVEIKATIAAARALQMQKHPEARVIAVFQAHRYTRLAALYDDFIKALSAADGVIVTDIYSAGEKVIDGISRAQFADDLSHACANVWECDTSGDVGAAAAELRAALSEHARAGDMAIFMGAGNISQMAGEVASPG